jgi:hypothetical protein
MYIHSADRVLLGDGRGGLVVMSVVLSHGRLLRPCRRTNRPAITATGKFLLLLTFHLTGTVETTVLCAGPTRAL